MRGFGGHNRNHGRVLGDKYPGAPVFCADATYEQLADLLGLRDLTYRDATYAPLGACPPQVFKARLDAHPERDHGDVVNGKLDALVRLAECTLAEQARNPGDVVIVAWH